MALTRFTESFIPSLEIHNKYVSQRKLTESEIANLETGNRLSESTKRYIEQNPVANLKAKTVYKMPVSRYDEENANGRIYSKKLWENVINNQKETYMGGLGLADHPEDDKDGSFKEASVVYLNLEMNESSTPGERLIFAECIFVGKYGKLAEEILEAGGRVGFSSSGFGELEEGNRKNVRPDTYMLERVADIVLNPSQNVFGKKENTLNKESANNNKLSTSLQEETQEMIKESVTPNNKFSKLEERKFRLDVTQFLEEAINISNPAERLSQLEEISSYFAEGVATDLKSQVDTRIEETKKEISNSISEYAKIKETFDVTSTEEIKEGLTNLAVDSQYFEKTASEWKNIALGLQETNKKLKATLNTRPTPEAFRDAIAFGKNLKETFEAKETEWKAFVEKQQITITKQTKTNGKLTEELAKATEHNAKLSETIKKYKEYTGKLKEAINAYQEQETQEARLVEQAKAKKNELNYKPKAQTPAMFKGFNESSKIEEYFEDLVKRHGDDILPIQEKILSCKVLSEAMRVYNSFLANSGKAQSAKISEALDHDERKALIEAQTGTKIAQKTNQSLRMPEGWD